MVVSGGEVADSFLLLLLLLLLSVLTVLAGGALLIFFLAYHVNDGNTSVSALLYPLRLSSIGSIAAAPYLATYPPTSLETSHYCNSSVVYLCPNVHTRLRSSSVRCIETSTTPSGSVATPRLRPIPSHPISCFPNYSRNAQNATKKKKVAKFHPYEVHTYVSEQY